MIGSSADGAPEPGRRRAEWLLLASEELSSSLRDWVPGVDLRAVTLPAAFASVLVGDRPRLAILFAPPAGAEEISLLARERQRRPGLRAVLVNEATAVDQRLEALRSGLDDALPDQIDPRELAVRLQRLVGEVAHEPGDRRLRIREGVELDMAAHELRERGQYVHLRPKGYRLLRLLASHPGVAFSRQQLLEQVWGKGHTADPRTVDVHVRWLRERIEAEPEHPKLLTTVRGHGYRFDPA